MRLTEQEKAALVSRYYNGESAVDICTQAGIGRSTFYAWIKLYQTIKTDSGYLVNASDFIRMKQHIQKLEQKIEILQKVDCKARSPLQSKLRELEKHYGNYPVHTLCEALDVSRGTFYNHIFRRKEVTVYDKRREEMRVKIKTVFEESGQRFGKRRITAVLAEQGIKTSEKYVAAVMQEMGLKSVIITSKKEHNNYLRLHKNENHLQRQFHVSALNIAWVSDITCFKIEERYYYTCIILDLFSRKVIAYRVSPKNSTYLVTSTFRSAWKEREHPENLTFHSDQGSQYTSNSFRKLLRMNKVVQSFSSSGHPTDNAVAEAFFASMKKEELYRVECKSEQQFRTNVKNYIDFYNTKRPHSSLAYKTPDDFEAKCGDKKATV